MGKPLLILVLALALGVINAACDVDGAPSETDSLAHQDQSCASCHQGPQGERGRATVPAQSCTSGGCHEDGGPAEVSVGATRFPHRDHAEGADIEPSCAGCHTHESGDAPLVASVDACALCHIGEVANGDAQECRLCHAESDHSELTSQGVTVSHSEIPWVEIGCVRCHYDVATGGTEVSGRPCRECHADMAELNERAVGRDLHPIHDGVTCASCHQEDVHEVQAMSSVVDLVCSDCHVREHGVGLGADQSTSDPLCVTCHAGVHSAQQRLVLGVRPDSGVTPSSKFLAGITCRSCHVPPEVRSASAPVRGQAEACSECHSSEYEQVLDWWQEGLRTREKATREYIDRAARRLDAAPDSAGTLLETARQMLLLVTEGGGQHNLELSDRLMRDAIDRVQEAYEVAGQTAAPPPDLGRAPHMGLCSYCHYPPDQMWNLGDMPEDFHRTVLGAPE